MPAEGLFERLTGTVLRDLFRVFPRAPMLAVLPQDSARGRPPFGPCPAPSPWSGGLKGRETVGRRKLFVAINEYLLWTYGRFVVDLHRRNENASFYVRQVDADEAFVGLFKKSHIFLLEESD